MSGPASQMRRGEAAAKAKKVAKVQEKISFEIMGQDEDILIKDGPYRDKFVSQMFLAGAKERDYVVQHIWFSNDERAMSVIRKFLC
jgi:hypothetical protein